MAAKGSCKQTSKENITNLENVPHSIFFTLPVIHSPSSSPSFSQSAIKVTTCSQSNHID